MANRLFDASVSPEAVPEADSRGPWAYLWWLVRIRPGPLLLSALLGMAWMVPLALLPLVIGRAIDVGGRADGPGALYLWALVALGLGILQAVVGMRPHPGRRRRRGARGGAHPPGADAPGHPPRRHPAQQGPLR